MKEGISTKILLYGIVFLFIGASVIPNISGDIGIINNQSKDKKVDNFLLNRDYVNVYWKFNDCSGSTLTDSAHNYDGIIEGATWTTSGYTGCALIFDGQDDYVNLNTHTHEIAQNKTDDCIYSFYFKSTSGGIIFSTTSGVGYNPAMQIELIPNNGTLLFKIWTLVCGIALYSTGSYNNGQWHHAEFYFNGITANPTLTLYVDGTFDNTITHWLCEVANDDFSKTRLGMHAYYSSDYYEGVLDEFKITKYEGGNKQVPPTIDGPTSGNPNVNYEYTFVTNDPENDDILLYVDWDDGSNTGWIGPYSSGELVTLNHKWVTDGFYIIKARSQDSWGKSHTATHEVRIGNQAPDKPTISGPKHGNSQQQLTYTFLSRDYEDEDIKYFIDWDDGQTEETEYVESNTSVELSHSWTTNGDYNITARAIDSNNKIGDRSGFQMRIGDQPPSPPNIYGAVHGYPDVEYDYGIFSIDPENDNLTYDVDWGDGNIETDIGPFPSGVIFPISHTWTEMGTYSIKSRAKDEYDYYSSWSEHKIYVPRTKATFNFNLLDFLVERFPRVFFIFRYLLGGFDTILLEDSCR
ncbi:hypothetical protein AYK20_01820 [Thermoplasmatales archaeon SG8-52-1]|nr:MAG: hypothetical protein AYK20_01820 [Thermoplasmatales archaeon SG8-52-1]